VGEGQAQVIAYRDRIAEGITGRHGFGEGASRDLEGPGTAGTWRDP
jgi:hypothetical protein